RVAGERDDIAVSRQHAAIGDDAADAATLRDDCFDRGSEAEDDALRLQALRKPHREQMAIAGLVRRQMQAAGKSRVAGFERRLDRKRRIAIDETMLDIEPFED